MIFWSLEKFYILKVFESFQKNQEKNCKRLDSEIRKHL